MRIRNVKGNPKKTCSKCGKELEPSRVGKQRYCKACHAEHARKNRVPISDLTEEQRKKKYARAYASEYTRRGKLIKQPCAECGNPDTQRHHKDYSKPLEVIWLCADCHKKLHKMSTNEDFKESIISPSVPSVPKVKICSKCGEPQDRSGRYCKACHNAYMRDLRGKQKAELERLRQLEKQIINDII